MLRAGTKAGISQPVQEIIQSLPGIQDAKLSLEDSTDNRAVENGHTIFLGGACLQTTAELLLSMAGQPHFGQVDSLDASS